MYKFLMFYYVFFFKQLFKVSKFTILYGDSDNSFPPGLYIYQNPPPNPSKPLQALQEMIFDNLEGN